LYVSGIVYDSLFHTLNQLTLLYNESALFYTDVELQRRRYIRYLMTFIIILTHVGTSWLGCGIESLENCVLSCWRCNNFAKFRNHGYAFLQTRCTTLSRLFFCYSKLTFSFYITTHITLDQNKQQPFY